MIPLTERNSREPSFVDAPQASRQRPGSLSRLRTLSVGGAASQSRFQIGEVLFQRFSFVED